MNIISRHLYIYKIIIAAAMINFVVTLFEAEADTLMIVRQDKKR